MRFRVSHWNYYKSVGRERIKTSVRSVILVVYGSRIGIYKGSQHISVFSLLVSQTCLNQRLSVQVVVHFLHLMR